MAGRIEGVVPRPELTRAQVVASSLRRLALRGLFFSSLLFPGFLLVDLVRGAREIFLVAIESVALPLAAWLADRSERRTLEMLGRD